MIDVSNLPLPCISAALEFYILTHSKSLSTFIAPGVKA